MAKHIKQLKQFVYDNAGNNQHTINEDNLQECLKSIEAVLRSFFKGRKPSLSPSGMSAEKRKIWHLLNKTKGDNRDQFKPTSRLKMLISSVAEFVIVFLMKEAGVPLTHEQENIDINLDGFSMRGSNDYALHSQIVDFKCTGDEMYKQKWRSAKSIGESDDFGYIGQAAAYNHGASFSTGFMGWDVFNLNTGDIKHISAKTLDYAMDMELEHIENKVREVKVTPRWEDIEPCQQPFQNAKGEMQLHWICARCPFVETCHPEYKKTKKDLNQCSYIKEK